MSSRGLAGYLMAFIIVVRGVCLRRFQLVGPAGLLAVPGWFYRGSSSQLVQVLSWVSIVVGLAILVVGLTVPGRQVRCVSPRDGSRALYLALAAGAVAIGCGIAAGRLSGAPRVVASALMALLLCLSVASWLLVDSAREAKGDPGPDAVS